MILMAEDVAGAHRRDVAVVEVQVGAADRGRGDLEDRIARIDDFGIGNGVDANVVAAVPGECAHGWPPRCAIRRAFALAAGRGRIGRHLAGFQQLLEPAQVAAALHRRLALQHLGGEPAELPPADCRSGPG